MNGDGFRSSSPGTEVLFLAGVILADNSWRISSSAIPCLKELIVSISVHCEIVHRLGSEFEGAGGETHPASEILLRKSCPTHLGCMLGLMSAEQINMRDPF